MAEFNARLKEAFRFSGKSQQELVNYLKVNKSVVSTWVGGRNTPNTVEKMVKIANFFNVNPAWLAGFDEPVKKIKLSDPEIKLVEMFRELGEANQNLILNTIKALPKEEKTQEEKTA